MAEGIDCASPVPNPAAVRAAGKRFVCRYISPGNWTQATKDELAACRKAGLAVVLVFETTATRALAGEAAGRADAAAARVVADGFGFPAKRPIYFAFDFDVQPSQDAWVMSYIKGLREANAGPVGTYGGYALTALAAGMGVTYLWQAAAWSGGRWHSKSRIQQYLNDQHIGSLSVDLDRSMVADYGQWDPPAVYLVVSQGGEVVRRIKYGGGRVHKYLSSTGFVRLLKRGGVKLSRRKGS